MKPFWRNYWAAILASVTLTLIGILIIFIAMPSADAFTYGDHSVLKIDFKDRITEKSYSKIDPSSFSIKEGMGIKEIKTAILEAKDDDKIKGLYLNVSNIHAGMASTEEIRNAIFDFKESGKFVIAYAEMYSQKTYYLATAADEIYLNPAGLVEFRGLGTEIMFFKGIIDKLGIDMQIIRGSNNKFKSAVEPFMLDSMSPANRKQTMTYMNALWNQMLDGISKERNISISKLNEMADSVYVRNSATSLEYNLVDGLKFEDEVFDILKSKTGYGENDNKNFISFAKYAYNEELKEKAKISDDTEFDIAIVYAVGGIESGTGGPTTIGSETIAKAIRDARLDDNIKGIVLRVNSPGGSALASDIIWREVVLCTQAGKPIVTSMGDVAASGGYYIACATDRIFAQPNTITGSIGVFGVLPNFGPMLEDKFGITTSRVETNEHSVLTLTKALTEDEEQIIQDQVDQIYDDFISKVAEGRGMTKEAVDEIGQGRVWAGSDAIDINLVDELGGIDEAIAYVAKEIGKNVSDLSIKHAPNWDDEIAEFLKKMEFDNSNKETKSHTQISTQMMDIISTLDKMSAMKGVQARLPFEFVIE